MRLWQEDKKEDKQYLEMTTEEIIHSIMMTTGFAVKDKYEADEIAEAMCNIKIRDALLFTMNKDKNLILNFLKWWNKNSVQLRVKLTEHQKSFLLGMLAGALLIIDNKPKVLEALELSKSYAAVSKEPVSGLTMLLERAMKYNVPSHVWTSSLSQVTLEEIYGGNNN